MIYSAEFNLLHEKLITTTLRLGKVEDELEFYKSDKVLFHNQISQTKKEYTYLRKSKKRLEDILYRMEKGA